MKLFDILERVTLIVFAFGISIIAVLSAVGAILSF